MFLSVGTNVTSLTMYQTVTFSVVATDPDGVADLIGGTLKTETGSATYGALITTAQEGAYSLTLSWEEINRVSPITFTTEERRKFRVELFDQAGHRAQTMVEVTLTCGGTGSCAGLCTNLSNDFDNCGGCGVQCPSGANRCSSGKCEVQITTRATASCDAVCAGAQKTCNPVDPDYSCFEAVYQGSGGGSSIVTERFSPPCTTVPHACYQGAQYCTGSWGYFLRMGCCCQ